MTSVLFDINILLDVFLHREPHFLKSAQAVDLAGQGLVQGFVCGHAVPTLAYLLDRHLSSSKSRALLSTLLTNLQVATVNDRVIRQALVSPFRDFEDAVSHGAAREAGVAVIVTRNVRDFAKGTIPAMLPEAFLVQYGSSKTSE